MKRKIIQIEGSGRHSLFFDGWQKEVLNIDLCPTMSGRMRNSMLMAMPPCSLLLASKFPKQSFLFLQEQVRNQTTLTLGLLDPLAKVARGLGQAKLQPSMAEFQVDINGLV